MPIQRLQDLGREGIEFLLGPFSVKVHPSVREVLDETGDVETAGNAKDLGTEAHPLDVASIPDFPVGDMG
jgi:hypothetical protein